MQIIERDVLVEENPSGGVWYIPVSFYDPDELYKVYIGNNIVSVVATTVSYSNNTVSQVTLDSTGWLQPSANNDVYSLCIPASTSFTQYISVSIELTTDEATPELVALPITINIRKAPASGGSGSGSGSSSSISVPTAPEIAEAVWNYGAEEGDETIADRTLSTTVEVNPSAIAQAVWNYSVAEPASGTLGTRTLTTAIPTAANIATAVLTTDVGTMVVGTDDYTVKHLIMASQKSEVVTDNGATVWKIRDERLDSETNEATVIASRTLTINSNGAIVKTE